MLNEVLVQDATVSVGGPGGNGNYASPADVPDGVVAFFPPGSANSVDLSSNSFEDYDQLQLVRGTPSTPLLTNVIHPSEVTVLSRAYQAPRKQVDTLNPSTVVSDTRGLGFKITSWDMNDAEPYDRQTYDTQILSGDLIPDIISKLAHQVLSLPVSGVNNEGYPRVRAGGDGAVIFVPSSGGNSGPAEIYIDGVTYEVGPNGWAGDKAATTTAFVNQYQTEILAQHGLWVYSNGNDNIQFDFPESALNVGDITYDDDAGGLTAGVDLGRSETPHSNLVIEAEEFGYTFQTSIVGNWGASVSTTTNFREGTGSYEQVKEMEEYVHGFQGRYEVDDGILGRQEDLPVFAVEGETYDIITLRSPNDVDQSVNKMSDPQDIVVPIPTSNEKTNINNFLSAQGVSL